MAKAICRERDCTTRAKTRGWCNRHYLRWWKHGHPGFTLAIVGDDLRRFHSKIEVGPPPDFRPDLGECWIWCGTVKPNGYGEFSIGQANLVAHRVAYDLFIGPIPAGLQIDHLCRVRRCVRPSHLEPVTGAENLRRAAAIKTHCPSGHPYSGANLALTRQGWRQCRECGRRRRREWGQRRAAKMSA